MAMDSTLAGPQLAAALGTWTGAETWHLEPQWLRLLHEAIGWEGDPFWVPQLGIVATHFRTAVRPPIPLERPATRLNAGQEFRFQRRLVAGETIVVRARLTDAVAKTGRSGELLFVTTEIDYGTPGGDSIGVCLQTTVHRPLGDESRSGDPGAPVRAPGHHASGLPGVSSVTLPACDPRRLVQWAAASGDLNPLHYDADQARREGYPGIIVTGSLKVALLEAALQRWRPAAWIASLDLRHTAWDLAGDPLEARWDGEGPGPSLRAEVGPPGLVSLQASVGLGAT